MTATAVAERLLDRIRVALPEGRPLPDDVWRRRHRVIIAVLWLHAAAMPVVGLATGNTAGHSFFEAGIVASIAFVASLPGRGRKLRAAAAALGLVTSSGLLVHFSGGYIEAHFHFFVMVALMTLYQDWVPFLLAIGFVVAHHAVVGTLDPASVYNHPAALAHPWVWAGIHAAFITALSAVCLVCWRFNEQLRARFELILDAAGEGICGIDREGRVIFANAAAARMTGWTAGELIGRRPHEAFGHFQPDGPPHAEAACPIEDAWRAGLARHSAGEMFRRKDGRSFPVEYVSTPAVDRGQVAGAVVLFSDISERRRIDRLRDAQHAVTRALADSATIEEGAGRVLAALGEGLGWEAGGLWLADGPQRVLCCVRMWAASGAAVPDFAEALQHSTFTGIGLPGRVWASGEPAWVADLAQDRDFPGAGSTARDSLHASFGFPVRLGGQVLGVIELFSREVREPDAELLGAILSVGSQVGQFIERKRGEEALRQAEATYRDIFDHAVEGIFQTTADGRFLKANPALARLYGYDSPEELTASMTDIGRQLYADPGRRDEFLRRLEVEGSVTDFESRARHKGGSIVWISESSRAVRDAAGALLHYEGTVRDITERKRVEEMKSDFVSFVTHQLRTPLSGVKWLLELAAQQDGVPAEAGSLIEDARGSADRLIRLVNELLDIARLESGKVRIDLTAIALDELTRGVLDDVGGLIRERAHGVCLEVAGEVPPVSGDAQLVRQVVLNLTSNALKYTPPGGRITISLRQDADVVRWAVQDSGIGIPADAQSRLFEKFYRADNVTSVDTEGTGLGLYLVRLIVERLDGRVWFESAEGGGTTFFFTLPIARSDKWEPTEHTSLSSRTTATSGGPARQAFASADTE